jgi:hypothetical protein
VLREGLGRRSVGGSGGTVRHSVAAQDAVDVVVLEAVGFRTNAAITERDGNQAAST